MEEDAKFNAFKTNTHFKPLHSGVSQISFAFLCARVVLFVGKLQLGERSLGKQTLPAGLESASKAVEVFVCSCVLSFYEMRQLLQPWRRAG